LRCFFSAHVLPPYTGLSARITYYPNHKESGHVKKGINAWFIYDTCHVFSNAEPFAAYDGTEVPVLAEQIYRIPDRARRIPLLNSADILFHFFFIVYTERNQKIQKRGEQCDWTGSCHHDFFNSARWHHYLPFPNPNEAQKQND
jgi:hypothetical protein